MPYLKISVSNKEAAKKFYTEHLGLFKGVTPERVSAVDSNFLVLDFVEIGSDEHLEKFETNEHVRTCLMISAPENVSHETIGKRLKSNNVNFSYDFSQHLCFVKVSDPSGNKLSVSCSAMAFQFE